MKLRQSVIDLSFILGVLIFALVVSGCSIRNFDRGWEAGYNAYKNNLKGVGLYDQGVIHGFGSAHMEEKLRQKEAEIKKMLEEFRSGPRLSQDQIFRDAMDDIDKDAEEAVRIMEERRKHSMERTDKELK